MAPTRQGGGDTERGIIFGPGIQYDSEGNPVGYGLPEENAGPQSPGVAYDAQGNPVGPAPEETAPSGRGRRRRGNALSRALRGLGRRVTGGNRG